MSEHFNKSYLINFYEYIITLKYKTVKNKIKLLVIFY